MSADSQIAHAYQMAFTSLGQFRQFLRDNPWSIDSTYIELLANHIRRRGTVLTRRFGPKAVTVVGPNYREGIRAEGIPARNFAMLDMLDEHTQRDEKAEVLCFEGVTPFAKMMRSIYPRIVCSEFAPNAVEQERIAPAIHVDMHAMQFRDSTFDALVSGDVLEHVPFLNQALRECRRVLKSHGQLIATFPFAWHSETTIQRAVLQNDRLVHLLEPPEYHGNPLCPGEGALVFQVLGWDVLDSCRDAGFRHAEMLYISDPARGIMQAKMDGLFLLRAVA